MSAELKDPQAPTGNSDINAAVGDVLDKAVVTLDSSAVAEFIQQSTTAELARFIESVPAASRAELWGLVPATMRCALLPELHQAVLLQLAKELPNQDIASAVEKLPTDDLTRVVEAVPDGLSRQVLEQLSDKRRQRVERALSYDEDSAMRLLDYQVVEVQPAMTAAEVLALIKQRGDLPPATDRLVVVDDDKQYLGMAPLGKLLAADAGVTVATLTEPDFPAVSVGDSRAEVAQLFQDRDLIAAPVIDENRQLLGRITVDDVVDVIHDQAEKPVMQMAGLDTESDLFAPIVKSAKSRAVWLGINLITAFMAAAVIGLFTEALEKIVALAVLMPVVASMGGIAGSQTLTLTIRGISLGQVSTINALLLAKNELAIGAINGVLWALIIGASAWLWFGSSGVAFTISVAILVNMLAAAISGIAVPLALHRVGQDPALSGAVVLTTVTDVVGFMTFLGLSSALLL